MEIIEVNISQWLPMHFPISLAFPLCFPYVLELARAGGMLVFENNHVAQGANELFLNNYPTMDNK